MFLRKTTLSLVCTILTLAFANVLADDAAGLLNPNTASTDELRALAHLGEAEVSAIVAGRPFATIGDLNATLNASLSDQQVEDVYGQLFVPINLNDASREDILLIPGVGRRMAHEFEEYRPYRNMEQFRREIGKYVDEEEVARLERYVTLD